MRKVLTLSLAFLFLAASFALAGTQKAGSHGRAAHGTVASLDGTAKTFVLKQATGKEMKVSWNDATAIKGGSLKEGDQVEIRTVEKDGAHVATAIQIESAKQGKPASK
jgi:uncharacterized protein (DUF58 family)